MSLLRKKRKFSSRLLHRKTLELHWTASLIFLLATFMEEMNKFRRSKLLWIITDTAASMCMELLAWARVCASPHCWIPLRFVRAVVFCCLPSSFKTNLVSDQHQDGAPLIISLNAFQLQPAQLLKNMQKELLSRLTDKQKPQGTVNESVTEQWLQTVFSSPASPFMFGFLLSV